ncbi:zinc finger CCCH domain-containing protein 55-like [Typha angustifolia]|uniref:zinc finger CCCH domain-containing protein 55-like n=1 Tax=Typha angustifolia TaxID=59011 RepID=UPI003C308A19
MTDNVRRRISKWDVKEDPPVEVDIRECDPCKVKELSRSSNIDRNQLPEFSGPKPMHETSSEADKKMPYWSKKDDSSYRSSKVYSQKLHSPQAFDMETVYKNGSKKSYWEQESRNQDTVKNADGNGGTDGWGAAIDWTYSSSMSPSLDARRQHSRSASPRGGWNRSSRKRSRTTSRSRSRSRSPNAVKHGSERWGERGRMAGGSAPPCRDFAAGRCRRGSQCRYFHDDGGRRHFDSYYNADARESRSERVKYSGYESKQNFVSPREQSDYSRNKPSERHGSHYDDNGWEKPELHGNIKSTERCYDFTKGRCHRGASCRYIHHEPSSQGERSMKDESRERTHERNDPDVSFGRRPESRRVSENPCKYFAEGRCRRGEDCRFSHQGVPQSRTEDRAPDDSWGYDHDSQSRNDSQWSNQATILDAINTSKLASENDGTKIAVPLSMDRGDAVSKHQDQCFENIKDNQESSQKNPAFQKQDVSEETSGQHQQLPIISTQMMANITTVRQYSGITSGSDPATTNNLGSQPKMNSATPSTEQNFGPMGQIQKMVLQPPGQTFSPNAPALAFNSQIQQANYPVHPIGQTEFMVQQPSSNTQNFAVGLQGQPVLSSHVGPNQQGYNLGGQGLQNIPPPLHNGQGQQHAAFGGQQNNPPPQSVISQKNFNLSVQTQHKIPLLEGQIQQNISVSGQRQQILTSSQNGQSGQIVQPLALSAQNQYEATQTPSNLQNLQSADGSVQGSDNLDTKPSGSSSGSLITNKVVTSEQAARITDLSASLAHFFGTADLNAAPIGLQPSQSVLNTSTPRSSTEATSAQPNPGPWTQLHHDSKSDISKLPPVFSLVPAELKDSHMEESQTGVSNLIPLSVAEGTNNGNSANSLTLEGRLQHESQQISESKEVNEAEIVQSKKELAALPEDGVADVQADGENKRSKEAKGIKMFKCALIEFVKDILKPAWKEGHLSKEAHKTIVKKVVEKVTGAMQGPNIPQTQEKIDAYLSYSKAKLNKLVQAYVEKYVKS